MSSTPPYTGILAIIEADPQHIDDVKAACESMVAPTRAEPGCLFYELLQDPKHPHRFTFFEGFRDDAAFHAHANSPHFLDFAATIEPWIATPPHITHLTPLAQPSHLASV